MRKVLIPLVVVIGGVLWGVVAGQAPAAAPPACPPGQVSIPNAPYCASPPAACSKLTSKLSLLRGTFSLANRTIDILAPITKLASGNASIKLQSAGKTTTFSAPVDSATGAIKVKHKITSAQARLGSGILTISYPGDADTRAQVVRVRAANSQDGLDTTRPTISPTGLLTASGTVSTRARGVVRVQIEYVNAITGVTTTLEFKTKISNGKWSLSTQLSASILAQILTRCGTVESYILFTGYIPRHIRGAVEAFQVLPAL